MDLESVDWALADRGRSLHAQTAPDVIWLAEGHCGKGLIRDLSKQGMAIEPFRGTAPPVGAAVELFVYLNAQLHLVPQGTVVHSTGDHLGLEFSEGLNHSYLDFFLSLRAIEQQDLAEALKLSSPGLRSLVSELSQKMNLGEDLHRSHLIAIEMADRAAEILSGMQALAESMELLKEKLLEKQARDDVTIEQPPEPLPRRDPVTNVL